MPQTSLFLNGNSYTLLLYINTYDCSMGYVPRTFVIFLVEFIENQYKETSYSKN